MSEEQDDRFTWKQGDVEWLYIPDKSIKQLMLGQTEPGKEEEEKTQEFADKGNDDAIETEGGIAPERMDRFVTQASDIVWLDRYLWPIQQEENRKRAKRQQPALGDGAEESLDEEDEDETICQGPFWPSPDDPDTGYCTCCEQAYYGDLLNHSCLSDDDGEMEDDDEDAEERPMLNL